MGINNLAIKTKNDQGELVLIPHRKTVKYLGMHLDNLLRCNIHIDTQLIKAAAAFKANGRLFHNRHLSKIAKLNCYQLLVRPLLTYASPIWWNASASSMERMRIFERRCLRACLSLYRSAHTDFKHQISNYVLFNTADIPRIDNFIIKLTRDYFSKLPAANNKIIKGLSTINWRTAPAIIKKGYFSPQHFMFADRENLIQNNTNVPILYHWKRNKANKKIAMNKGDSMRLYSKFTYSTTIPDRDIKDSSRKDTKKYWWLNKTLPNH